MSSVDEMIPSIRQSCKALLDLTESPDTTNLYWYAEMGVHLQIISQIYNGELISSKQYKLSFSDKVAALLLKWKGP